MSEFEQAPEDRPEVLPAQPNAANPVEIKKRRERRKIDDQGEVRLIREILANPIGRSFLWRIIHGAGTFEERFPVGLNGSPIDQEIWFNAGQQAFGQRLYQTWDFLDHDGVSLMLREHDPRFLAKAN